MPCAKTADHSLAGLTVPTRVALRWPAFIATIEAIHDVFREALDMRRVAHNSRRLNDE
jgi:hypothetical protein